MSFWKPRKEQKAERDRVIPKWREDLPPKTIRTWRQLRERIAPEHRRAIEAGAIDHLGEDYLESGLDTAWERDVVLAALEILLGIAPAVGAARALLVAAAEDALFGIGAHGSLAELD